MTSSEKTLIGVLVGLILAIGGVFFVGNLIINRVTDKVIERLQREYCPSPYGPSFDPDKLTPHQQQPPPTKTTWQESWDNDRR